LFGLESLVIYVIIWWLTLFVTLPFGISRDKKVLHGNDPGAPKKTLLKKKILITSLASLILTIIFSIIKNEIF
jgi:predicted secreted protein